MTVRELFWEDEPCRRRRCSSSSSSSGEGEGEAAPRLASPPPHERTMLRDQRKRAPVCGCPSLAPGEQFDVILGADLLYDGLQVAPLARAVSNRLRPGGLCRMILTVRESALLPALIEQVRAAGACLAPLKHTSTTKHY